MKRSWFLMVLCLPLLLCGCAQRSAEREFFAMDTVMQLRAYGPEAEAALSQAEAEIYRLEGALSCRDEHAALARLNKAGGGTADAETAALLQTALTLCEKTGGAYDPALGALSQAWGFSTGAYRVPEQDALAEAMPESGAGLVQLDGTSVKLTNGAQLDLGGIAKGSGTIHPNMGTMLCFITTDCAIDPSLLRSALREVVSKTFNRISVDGDTSTNDTCIVMANGMAGNELLDWKSEEYHAFYNALYEVALTLAKKMAADGEGASRLISCTVKHSRAEEYAERLAKAVIASSLVKAAMYGADANWGRVLCAMGYSKAPFRPEFVNIGFSSAAGSITVCENGEAVDFDEDAAKKILLEKEVSIDVDIQEGEEEATAYGCDLTYDYVRINGDYRT